MQRENILGLEFIWSSGHLIGHICIQHMFSYTSSEYKSTLITNEWHSKLKRVYQNKIKED